MLDEHPIAEDGAAQMAATFMDPIARPQLPFLTAADGLSCKAVSRARCCLFGFIVYDKGSKKHLGN